MTEDDTFRKLAQRPYEEVREELIYFQKGIGRKTQKVRKEILDENYWTVNEWNKALNMDPRYMYKGYLAEIGSSAFYRKFFN